MCLLIGIGKCRTGDWVSGGSLVWWSSQFTYSTTEWMCTILNGSEFVACCGEFGRWLYWTKGLSYFMGGEASTCSCPPQLPTRPLVGDQLNFLDTTSRIKAVNGRVITGCFHWEIATSNDNKTMTVQMRGFRTFLPRSGGQHPSSVWSPSPEWMIAFRSG